jgi:hypothetical protein
MPDEIKVDGDKFDAILARMLAAKPLPKAEISARIKAKREASKVYALELKRKNQKYKSKKLGQ